MTTTAPPTATADPPAIDQDKLMEFVFRSVGEVAATLGTALAVMGDRLGYYRVMADGGPISAADLARRAGTGERYATEWLNAQAAGGTVDYDPATGTYRLPPEHAVALTDPSSPLYLQGLFQIAYGTVCDSGQVFELARDGDGLGWGEHGADVIDGCERFFAPSYNAHLVAAWLPALEGVVPKLERGARVHDLGCGHGASTVLMARAFPASTFVGSDAHAGSIETARERAAAAGVRGQRDLRDGLLRRARRRHLRPGHHVRRLHDMGDPVGAARRVHDLLAARRNLDDRGAGGRGPDRGQPQPGRAGLLWLLHAALHARLALAGGRTGDRHPGGPGPDPRHRHRGRILRVPRRGPDALQQRAARSARDRPRDPGGPGDGGACR